MECSHCGAEFQPTNFINQKYCRSRCCWLAWKARNPTPPLVPIACAGCHIRFMPTNRRHRYCTPACNRAANPEKTHEYHARYRAKQATTPCRNCGTLTDNRAYCSRDCEALWKAKLRPPKGRVCRECGCRFSRRGPLSVCVVCRAKMLAAESAALERVRDLRRVAGLVKVTLWAPCPICSARFGRSASVSQTYCSRTCSGLGNRGHRVRVPRDCESCGVRFRPTERRPDATHCWECVRPKSDGLVYSHVKEHLKKRLERREGGRCEDCGLTREDVGERLQAHHIEPQALGGPNVLENLKLLCPDCHVGSGWMRHHFALVEAGLVVPPVVHQVPQLRLVA